MIEANARKKIAMLIERAQRLVGTPQGLRNEEWVASTATWLAETENVVALAVSDYLHPYRKHISLALGYGPYEKRLRTTASMLEALVTDSDGGLLTGLLNKVRTETFDNFLDHAVEYRKKKYKNQAGVIAGVVFEDTIRKIYSDKIGPHSGKPLEELINGLAKQDIISEQQSKQAKVAAHVRTKATHALWDEFDLEGVDTTIGLTRTLLHKHMGG